MVSPFHWLPGAREPLWVNRVPAPQHGPSAWGDATVRSYFHSQLRRLAGLPKDPVRKGAPIPTSSSLPSRPYPESVIERSQMSAVCPRFSEADRSGRQTHRGRETQRQAPRFARAVGADMPQLQRTARGTQLQVDLQLRLLRFLLGLPLKALPGRTAPLALDRDECCGR